MLRRLVGTGASLLLAAGVYLLFMGHGTAVEFVGGGVLEMQDPDAVESAGPVLAGGAQGMLPDATLTPTGQTVHGTVIDATGKPKAGVRVGLRYLSPVVDPLDPRTTMQWHQSSMQRSVDGVMAPTPSKSVAFVVTDDKGHFELPGVDRGNYLVRAEPESPLFGTHQHLWVRDRKVDALTLRTGAGNAVTGKVLDLSDKPVQAVMTVSANKLDHPPTHRGTWIGDPVPSDADGSFALDGLPPGTYRGTLIVPGRFRISGIPLTVPHEETWVIRVPSGGGSLAGTVKDMSGETVANADIVVNITVPDLTGTAFQAVARSGEDGKYMISNLPTGPVTKVRAGATGYVAHESSMPLADWAGATIPAKGAATIDIVLIRGATVHGRVHTAVGNAVAGVAVMVVPSRWRAPGLGAPGPLSASTDEEGIFRIEGVPLGKHVLFAQHKAYYIPCVEEVANSAGPPDELLVLVDASAKTVERNILLAKGISISGVVLTTDDEPVADAEIRTKGGLQDRWFSSWGVSAQTSSLHDLGRSDADGTFTIEGLAPRSDWVLAARAQDRLGQWSEPLSNEKDGGEPVTLRMESGVFLRGTVIDDDGPVANANVSFWTRNQKFLRSQSSTRTKADGTFEIPGIPPGDAGINANDDSGRNGSLRVKGIEAGEDKEDLEIKLNSSGVEVGGMLVDEESKPLANYRIQASGSGPDPYGRTDSAGKFLFKAGPKGKIRFRIQQPGTTSWQWTEGRHHSPADDIEVTFKPKEQRIVQGHVLGPDGKPVPLLFVHAAIGTVPKEGHWRYNNGANTEVVGGSFKLVVVGEGKIWVRVSNPRGSDGKPLNARGTAKQLEEGEEDNVEFTLESGFLISGVVKGPEGELVSGALVSAGRQMARTNPAGRFTLQGLKEGKISVGVRPPPKYSAPVSQSIATGTEDVEFQLLPSAVLRGRVTDADGVGVSGGRAYTRWKADGKNRSASARLDGEGRFIVKGIPAGVRVSVTISLWGRKNSGRVADPQKDVDPAGGEIVFIAERGAVISGQVVDEFGDPVKRIRVQATPAEKGTGRRSGSANTNNNGEFTLRSLNEGEYRINAASYNGLVSAVPFFVQAPNEGLLIKLPPSTTIRGRVNDPGGGSGWKVVIQKSQGGGTHQFNVKSDGTWVAPRVDLDTTYTVRAHNTNANLYAVEENVRAGAQEVVLEPLDGLTISGRVENSAGSAVQGWVHANGPGWSVGRKTDVDGNFTVGPFPPGRYSLWIYQYQVWDNQTQARDVSAGTNSLIVQLPK